MTPLEAILFGVIQGLTEFLPVSSSAHLLLAHTLLGTETVDNVAFDVALHLGTTLAILSYYAPTLWRIANAMLRYTDQSPEAVVHRRLGWRVALSCVPAGVVGLAFQEQIETVFRAPLLTGVTLIVFGLLLYLAEHRWGGSGEARRVSTLDALVIGLFQTLALVPGVSRSGITITGGLWRGLRRDEAAWFSFLMISPLVAAASLLKLTDLHRAAGQVGGWTPFLGTEGPLFLAGGLAALITGLACIHLFLAFLRRFSTDVFVLYRVLLGIGILIYAWPR